MAPMGILVSGDFTSVERLLLPSSCCWKMRGRRQLIHCRDLRPCRLQGPSLLLAAALLLTLATPAAAGKSKLWGSAGEAWSPSGRLMDWSYAGEPGRAEAAAGRAKQPAGTGRPLAQPPRQPAVGPQCSQ